MFRAGEVKRCWLPLVHDLEWGADFLFLSAIEVKFKNKFYESMKCIKKSTRILRV